METEKNGGWKLKSIEIKFEKGYNFREREEEKHDRYVGRIEFDNDDNETFNLKIPTEMTNRYMDLMRNDIIKTAEIFRQKNSKFYKISRI